MTTQLNPFAQIAFGNTGSPSDLRGFFDDCNSLTSRSYKPQAKFEPRLPVREIDA